MMAFRSRRVACHASHFGLHIHFRFFSTFFFTLSCRYPVYSPVSVVFQRSSILSYFHLNQTQRPPRCRGSPD